MRKRLPEEGAIEDGAPTRGWVLFPTTTVATTSGISSNLRRTKIVQKPYHYRTCRYAKLPVTAPRATRVVCDVTAGLSILYNTDTRVSRPHAGKTIWSFAVPEAPLLPPEPHQPPNAPPPTLADQFRALHACPSGPLAYW